MSGLATTPIIKTPSDPYAAHARSRLPARAVDWIGSPAGVDRAAELSRNVQTTGARLSKLALAASAHCQQLPPHRLHGTPPRRFASARLIVMQFAVHARADEQERQWYLPERTL